MVTGNKNTDSKVKLVHPRQVKLKEIPDGVGIVRDPSRAHGAFQAISKDKVWELQQPANGPSPPFSKFNPKHESILKQSPRFVESQQPRFNNFETIKKMKEKVGNPSFDAH